MLTGVNIITDEKLKQYFKFDESDLAANRNGNFSEKQKNKLYGRQSGAIQQKRIAVAITFPLAMLLFGWLGYLIFKGTASLGNFIILGFFGGVLLWASIYIFRLSFIRQKYLLKKAEGPVNIIKEQRILNDRPYTSYELHVDGMKFRASSDLCDLMMQGDTYAIYYSEGNINQLDEVLSAELIARK